jgi:hypothetical protein
MNATLTQTSNIVTISFDTVDDAVEVIALLTAKLNGTEITNAWVGLAEAAEILDMNQSTLAKQINRCEADRVSKNKPKWLQDKHYRRKPNTNRWQVNCRLVLKTP